MSDFLARLDQEELELNNKIIKLHQYVNSDFFPVLSDASQYLLKKQLEIMTEYSNILNVRIEFNTPSKLNN
jgi:hypothetical protein